MDKLEVLFTISGESKNCIIYEPEEGGDAVSKLYVRKSALGCTSTATAPQTVMVTIESQD